MFGRYPVVVSTFRTLRGELRSFSCDRAGAHLRLPASQPPVLSGTRGNIPAKLLPALNVLNSSERS